MKYFLFSFLFISNITAFAFAKPAHDMPLAFFDLMIEEDKISLNILVDKIDLEKAVGHQLPAPLSSDKIENYLLKNMTWIFDQEKAEIEICSIEQIEDHYQVKAQFISPKKKVYHIKIINTCLIDSIEKHSNILNVEYEGLQRTFRLHKKRTQTFFELI